MGGFTTTGIAAGEGAGSGGLEQSDRENTLLITSRLNDIGDALKTLGDGSSLPSNNVTKVRDAMSLFLRANGKFPDYCEVGIAVFFDIYDWHVKNQRELSIGRQPDGRYGLQFMFTRLLLRHENDPGYVGTAYDLR
jgi:hypothetical protein